MTVSVPGLAFRGRAKQRGYVILALDVGLVCEVQIAAICLGFPGERGFQIFLGFRAFEFHWFLQLIIATRTEHVIKVFTSISCELSMLNVISHNISNIWNVITKFQILELV